MKYEAINMIAEYMQWGIALASAVIILRIVYIIQSIMTSIEENISLSVILSKTSNYGKGLLIAIIVESIIEVFQSYFFH